MKIGVVVVSFWVLFQMFAKLGVCQDTKSYRFGLLSGPEKRWVIRHPFVSIKAKNITDTATHEARRLSSMGLLDTYENGGKQDAFRHAYWMALLSSVIGPKKALLLGRAHEKGNKKEYDNLKLEEGEIPDFISMEMDLWNNDIGVDIGSRHKKKEFVFIKEMVLELINSGACRILKRNKDGLFMTCSGKLLRDKEWRGLWFNERCLMESNR